MLKISDGIYAIITKNPLLLLGIHKKLLNLSQVADFIKPLVEARVKKEVTKSAILMNLSRLQQRIIKTMPEPQTGFEIERMNVSSNLCILNYEKIQSLHEKVHEIYKYAQEKKMYMTVTEGVNEITLIVQREMLGAVEKFISAKPKFKHQDVSSVGIKFNEKYLDTPGFLYAVLQQLALQNINIREISSTATELIIYLDDKDTKLAFETLFNSFKAS